jgi:hypothetical protein
VASPDSASLASPPRPPPCKRETFASHGARNVAPLSPVWSHDNRARPFTCQPTHSYLFASARCCRHHFPTTHKMNHVGHLYPGPVAKPISASTSQSHVLPAAGTPVTPTRKGKMRRCKAPVSASVQQEDPKSSCLADSCGHRPSTRCANLVCSKCCRGARSDGFFVRMEHSNSLRKLRAYL